MNYARPARTSLPPENGTAKIYKICHLPNDNQQIFSGKISDFIHNAGKSPKIPFFNLLIINQDNNFQKCGFSKTIFYKFMVFHRPEQNPSTQYLPGHKYTKTSRENKRIGTCLFGIRGATDCHSTIC